MTIKEVHEKYMYLDKILCDTTFVDSLQTQVRYDMWQAIRAEATPASVPVSADDIAAILPDSGESCRFWRTSDDSCPRSASACPAKPCRISPANND